MKTLARMKVARLFGLDYYVEERPNGKPDVFQCPETPPPPYACEVFRLQPEFYHQRQGFNGTPPAQ